ncbi:ribosome-associated translation inhibitor RaiA [Bacteroidetes/Chlorobi group bacterium MS-B_bin-24]|jgi:putative sigma-54 modulation protein|nr:MAG: ribosome-associated translation inhibitor RaiA [Bacteroidetes/Chlorobi group bacterium MS-B_bin-24]
MQTKVTFRHLKSRPDLQEAALEAIKKFEKFSDTITSASVEFSSDGMNKVKFTVVVQGDTLIVEESSEDFMKSLRFAADKMVRQLKKHKEKIAERT